MLLFTVVVLVNMRVMNDSSMFVNMMNIVVIV